MAIVRPQRAAIQTLLAQSLNARVKTNQVATQAVVQEEGSEFPLLFLGVSDGDDTYNRFRDVKAIVFGRGTDPSEQSAICLEKDSVCVLDERVGDSETNERSVTLLMLVTATNGLVIFKKRGPAITYRDIV